MTVMGKLLSVFLSCLVLAVAVCGTASTAFAQEGPGGTINPGRDCQTITTCQFKKGGSYRGCLSSYSCRVCTYVVAPCRIAGGRGKVCRTSKCTWGG
jgi:hypothetical protein